MTEIMTQIRNEGAPAFANEENANSPASSAEETNTETQSPEGANTQDDPDKDKPFHEHPRWKQREDEWKKRFNDQEVRTQEELQKMRDEFAPKKADEAAKLPPIAEWFGGDEDQWAKYLADRKAELDAAVAPFKQEKEQAVAEEKAVKEATDFFHSEVSAIESDTDINPTGGKIDPNKLLKVTMDNDLVDSKGRWNYRAGFRLMQNQTPTVPKHDKDARKGLASATASEKKADTNSPAFKTSADFTKAKNRPW